MESAKKSSWKVRWQVFKPQVINREGFSIILGEFFHEEGREDEEEALLFPVCLIKM